MKRAAWTIAALAGAFLANAAAADTVAEHPDFTEDHHRPTRWVMLPVESSITRGRVTDAEPMIKETEALEKGLTREAAAFLSSLSYVLDAETLSPPALAADDELHRVADEARDRAREVLAQAGTDPKGIARGRFTIGEAGLPLAAATGADGLVLLQSQSYIVSKGSKALAAIFNPINLVSATRTRTQVLAAFYDLRDGQLLAVATGGDVGAVLKNPDEVARQVVESAFRELPPRGLSRPAKPKFRRAAAPRVVRPVPAATGRAPEAVLSDFEDVAAGLEAPGAAPAETEAAADPTEPSGGQAEVERLPAEAPAAPPLAPRAAEAERIQRLLDMPPEERPAPELQVVFLGEAGPTLLVVRNMAPRVLRVSVDRGAWQLMKAGGMLELAVEPGSHRLLVADAESEVELARAALVVADGRRSTAEIWPRAR